MPINKFAIRDFLWAVAVLGLALGWFLDRADLLRHSETARISLDEAKADLQQAERRIETLEIKLRLERELTMLREQLKVHQDARRTIGGGLKTQVMVEGELIDE
jgi:hypothetical protein